MSSDLLIFLGIAIGVLLLIHRANKASVSRVRYPLHGFLTVEELPWGLPFTVAQRLPKWPGYVICQFFGDQGIFLLKLPEQCHTFRAGDVLSGYLKDGKPALKVCALSSED